MFVVDDDPSLRTALTRLLASVGLRSETFSTADEFRRAIDPSRAGCLILDVRMPGLSGLDLQQQLTSAGYELPVIFVTAHADVALAVRVMKAGALTGLHQAVRRSAAARRGPRRARARPRPSLATD